MSQVIQYMNTTGASVVETLTGNIGGVVVPDGAHNINVIGGITQLELSNFGASPIINVIGNTAPNTLTLSILNQGVVTLQTTDDTQTPIFGLTLAEGSTVSIKATVLGATADYSSYSSGVFIGWARREVGMAAEFLADSTIPVNDNVAVTITFIASGNDFSLQVQGLVGVTYNWKARIEYDILDVQV